MPSILRFGIGEKPGTPMIWISDYSDWLAA